MSAGGWISCVSYGRAAWWEMYMFGSRRSGSRSAFVRVCLTWVHSFNVLLSPSRRAWAVPRLVVVAVAHYVLVGMVGRLRRPSSLSRLHSLCAVREDLIVLMAPLLASDCM